MIYYCPHCWAEIEQGVARCPLCGERVAEPEADFVDKMIGALRHPEPTRAALAVYVLTELLRESRAVRPLMALVQARPEAHVLCSAVDGLARLGDSRAVPVLAALVNDGMAVVPARVAAVRALGHIGGGSAWAALQRALNSDRPSVRRSAHQVLNRQCEQKE